MTINRMTILCEREVRGSAIVIGSAIVEREISPHRRTLFCMTRDRILLIEDEMDAVHVLRFALERAAFHVICVVASEDALPAALENEPHLVLLALEIGARDRRKNDGESQVALDAERRSSGASEAQRQGEGARLCRLLRGDARTKDVPIVLMSGHSRADSQTVEAFKAGADDLIAKPFRPADVVARVRALLDEKRNITDGSRFDFPDATALENRLRRALESGATWGVLFVDLLDFSDFNAQHGARRGDELLQDVARMVRDSVAHVAPQAFVAHAGIDRFVVVTAPEKLESLARDILARHELALHEIQLASHDEISPSMPAHEYLWPRLALAGVTNEVRRFRNPLEIASVALEIKRALRNRAGSGYLKDRRGGEYDPQRAPHHS